MPVITIQLEERLHRRLKLRAAGAQLSVSAFLRPLIEDAAFPGGRYVYTSQDELLGIAIQIYAMLAEFVSEQSPQALQAGAKLGRDMLRERRLLSPDDDPFVDVGGAARSSGEDGR